jgi:predicted ferric reductase
VTVGAVRRRTAPRRTTPRRTAPRRAWVRPAPLWWRDLAGTACWVTGLLVLALWLQGRGLQDLSSGTSAGLMSLGRLAGLLCADLLLIQVFLMARVPVIERSYGQDELARRHRLVGFWSFNLLLAHIALITTGYALADHANVVREGWTLLTSYGGMLLALAATVALTAVTVTSVRIARRALRYESWHLLHLYAYVGIALSIPHELWTGADFTASPWARTYWWGSYEVAAGAVLVFRLGLPAYRTLRHGITVTSVVRESDDVVTVHMGGRGLHRLPVRAGQFFVWRFLDGPGWSRGNPYSLSAAPRHDRIQITAKDLGDGSGRLARLRPGTRALVEGPYGRLTGEHRRCDRVAFLGCGIGITPLKALLEDLDFPVGRGTLVHRARTAPDLVLRAETELVAQQRGVDVHYLVGPRGIGPASWLPRSSGVVLDDVAALRRLVPRLRQTDVFVCGPDEWMDAVADTARRAGLPDDQLHLERFTW